MREIDAWRSAQLLVQQHGPDAILEAAKRQIVLQKQDDIEGVEAWGKIILAIDKLLREAPAKGERLQ